MDEPSTSDRVRVVVAVPAAERAHRAVRNLTAAADLPVEVEMVCYGAGIDMVLAGHPLAEETRALQDEGIGLSACANTLRARGLEADALIPGVTVVPAAVWHLARRQHEGWSYLSV